MTSGTAQPRVVLLLGPTAVGKSALLEAQGSLLRDCGAEVISADSRQVYRGMDAGTAKPSPRLRGLLPHHLIDLVDPDVQFTAGDFLRAADRAVAEITGRGGLPIVAGGAAFYLWSFLYGLPPAPPADPAVRQRLRARCAREGAERLHAELARIDAATAARLPVGDRGRIIRALEVFQLSGRPLSSFHLPTAPRREHQVLILGLERPREELYRRIERRVEWMFDHGLAAEVAALRARGYAAATPGLRSIGYAEFFLGLSDQAEVKALVKRNTRRFAKRQLSFFRRFPGVRWLPADAAAAVADAVRGLVESQLRRTRPATAGPRCRVV